MRHLPTAVHVTGRTARVACGARVRLVPLYRDGAGAGRLCLRCYPPGSEQRIDAERGAADAGEA